MDLRAGFKIDDPAVEIPWGATEQEVLGILSSTPPRRVTRRYVTLPVTVLGGLSCMLGFHFRPGPSLAMLEFFRTAYPDQKASFEEFQMYFERAFGAPSRTGPGDEGFLSHEWLVPGARIEHLVLNRFGPEEHIRIYRVA